MLTVNRFVIAVLTGFLSLFQSLHPFWPLMAVSLITGVFMLLLFRVTSNQKEISTVKNLIKAHLLEIRLFKDDLRVLLSAQKSIFFYNLKYLLYGIKPMLFMIVPVVILLIHLDAWFGWRPIRVGEPVLLAVHISDQGSAALSEAELTTSPGLTVETPSLRIPASREIDWRLRANAPGEHQAIIRVGRETLSKSITVSDGRLRRVSSSRVSPKFWNIFFHPGEAPLARDSQVNRIDVGYPSASVQVLNWNLHWILVFFVVSTLGGFALKGVFKVEI
jgi:uncharacterized membrane protein (DUF106 family)